jgi:hypothetical protein
MVKEFGRADVDLIMPVDKRLPKEPLFWNFEVTLRIKKAFNLLI